MKMRYLCARHCGLVQQDSDRARQLWQGAFRHGVEAYKAGQWQQAETFLGTAYEIALVRFAIDSQEQGRSLSAGELAAVGRYHANVLCRLESFDSAEACLRRVHDGLLHLSGAAERPYDERVSALEMVGEFRQKLVALLRMTGRGTYAKCTELMTRQLAGQAAASLSH